MNLGKNVHPSNVFERKMVQFGHKVQLVEGEKGFVTDYSTEHGNCRYVDVLMPALDRHHAMFGLYRDILVED